MGGKSICITEIDMARLRDLLGSSMASGRHDQANLRMLEGELDRARVVKSHDVPPDVVTMNSEVHLLDMNTREEMVFRIVYPHQADADRGLVSILAPMGTALLGYSVGDIIEWKVPSGTARWKVMELKYQPEASGDYHL